MDGLINIYKEKGYTSHDVVAIVRKQLQTKKVGHAGTLDPDAEGVLVVLVGKATKLSDYIMAESKEYRAEITFGIVTDTYDNTGKTIRTGIPAFSEERFMQVIAGFIGAQIQIPPMYSAISSGGVKLYSLAREGVDIERPGREIVINDINIESYNGSDKAVIYIKCGKGTYIRSLCYDIGEALGCGAHMSALVRTKSGVFEAEEGIKLSELKALKDKSSVLIGIEKALEGFPKIGVSGTAGAMLYNGGKIGRKHLMCDDIADERMAVVFDEAGRLIGIYDIIRDGNSIRFIKPRTMLGTVQK